VLRSAVTGKWASGRGGERFHYGEGGERRRRGEQEEKLGFRGKQSPKKNRKVKLKRNSKGGESASTKGRTPDQPKKRKAKDGLGETLAGKGLFGQGRNLGGGDHKSSKNSRIMSSVVLAKGEKRPPVKSRGDPSTNEGEMRRREMPYKKARPITS